MGMWQLTAIRLSEYAASLETSALLLLCFVQFFHRCILSKP